MRGHKRQRTNEDDDDIIAIDFRPASTHPNDIKDDVKWTTGDFEVITSDSVRFRVPSHYLFGASALFRDAQAHAPGGAVNTENGQPTYTLTLLDSTFETELIFRLFIDLIVEGTLLDGYYLPNTHLLVAFLRKWDCPVALQHMLLIVTQKVIDDQIPTLRAFAICAAAEDEAACSRIISNGAFGFPDAEPDWRHNSAVEPGNWPMYMWTDVPGVWSMALARAFCETGGCIKKRNYRAQVTESFEYWLSRLSERPSTQVALQRETQLLEAPSASRSPSPGNFAD